MWLHNAAVQKEAAARISRLPDSVVTNSGHDVGERDGVAMQATSDRDGVAMQATSDRDGVAMQATSDRDGVSVLVASCGQDALQSARLLQCRGFVDSEIRPYPSGSPQLARSMACLEQLLAQGELLQGEQLWAGDVVVAFPLLARGSSLQALLSSLPLLSAWLDRVREELPDLVARLLTEQPQGCRGKGEKAGKDGGKAGKDGKGDKAGKGTGRASSKQQAVKPVDRKLQILCLHGYRQSGKSFREKLGGLRKAVAKVAELTFMTAPHSVPGELDQGQDSDQFGWWFSRPEGTFDAHETVDCDLGYTASVAAVTAAWSEGQYDGLLSFSQGAALGAHLCLLQHRGRLSFTFRFAVIVAGFVSRSTQHMKDWQELQESGDHVSLPSLHVMGETDRVIEKGMSEHLLGHFSGASLVEHEGGHHVPASGEAKKKILAFLADMQETGTGEN